MPAGSIEREIGALGAIVEAQTRTLERLINRQDSLIERVDTRFGDIEARLARGDGGSAVSMSWRAAIFGFFGIGSGAIGAVVSKMIGAH